MSGPPPAGGAARQGARELLLFAVSGGLGFLVDVGVLYLCASALGWYGARVLSFLSAATFTWLFNRRYTFARRASGVPLWREYLGYLAAMLGGAVVNYGLYVLALHAVAAPWAPLAGVALGSVGGLGVNFASARWLVFRRRRGG